MSDLLSGYPPNEPLAESAPIAWRLAPTLCREDPASGGNCAWNHGLWQFLRLLGLNTTPEHHADFLKRALEAVVPRDGTVRVLISGTADYSMLAHVLAALRIRHLEARFDVVDLCETPLMLNRWYAEQVAQKIFCWRGDILEYPGEDDYDLICTHSFLGQFSDERRLELFRKWHGLLTRGGTVVTVNRVRATVPDRVVRFTSEQTLGFIRAVHEAAKAAAGRLSVTPEQLVRAAEVYASRFHAFPVRSLTEIRELLNWAEFGVEYLETLPVTAAAGARTGGPTIAKDADYAHIIARRR
jgi:hypothetical protein